MLKGYVSCLYLVHSKKRKIGSIYLSLPHDRMLLKLMLVMLEWKSTFQKSSAVGRHSVHST